MKKNEVFLKIFSDYPSEKFQFIIIWYRVGNNLVSSALERKTAISLTVILCLSSPPVPQSACERIQRLQDFLQKLCEKLLTSISGGDIF